MEDVALSLPTDKPILYGLQNLTKEQPALSAADLPCEIIICDELGCGVVPLDRADREWRERTGRLCCELAAKADRVDRVFCGLVMQIK